MNKRVNWFVINKTNMAVISGLFRSLGFGMPKPRNFGRIVESFDLSIGSSKRHSYPKQAFAETAS